MLVRMKTVARGPEFSGDPGQIVEVSAELGETLLAVGSAEPVEALWEGGEETASSAPAARRERATAPKRAAR